MEQTNDHRANLDQHVGRPLNLQLHASLRPDARGTLNVVAFVKALKPGALKGGRRLRKARIDLCAHDPDLSL